MAQQINLYSPILLTPKRYFSALAMLQALAIVALGVAALCAWATLQTRAAHSALQASEQSRGAEREQLLNAIAALPAQKDSTALEQELKALQQGVAERRRTLEDLSRGLASEGHRHSSLLRLVAQTVPRAVWLSELRLASGRIEIAGHTLEPAALQPWIGTLAASPLLAGQRLAAVKVERAASDTDRWSFTLLSESRRSEPGAAR